MKKIIMFMLALTVLLLVSKEAAAEQRNKEWKIEQGQLNAPSYKAYITDALTEPAAWEAVQFQGVRGAEKLEFQGGHPFDNDTEGIEYIYLIDNSGSIKPKQLKAVKKALLKCMDFLKEKDRVRILTFGGGSMEWLYKSGTSAVVEKKKLKQAIRSIEIKTGLGSPIRNAVLEVVQFADAERQKEWNTGDTSCQRKIAVVISDGQNYNKEDDKGKSETKTKLLQSNLPFYTVALTGQLKKGKDVSAFTALSDASHAAYRVIKKDKAITQGIIQMVTGLKTAYVAEFLSETNKISSDYETIQLTGTENSAEHIMQNTILANRYQKDETAPVIKKGKVKKQSDKSFRFIYSEPVSGAQNIKNYKVVDKKKEVLAIENVIYNARYGTCEIVMKEPLVTGDYTIDFFNIADISMEKNPVKKIEFHFEGKNAFLTEVKLWTKTYWWVILLAGIALIVAFTYRGIRKHGGIIKVDGQMGFRDGWESSVHIRTPATAKIRLCLEDSSGSRKTIDYEINGSLFIGRDHRLNNISFNDKKMSKQHLVLDYSNGECYITNLSNTNGTILNHQMLHTRQKLYQGDVIIAGREKIIYQGISN